MSEFIYEEICYKGFSIIEQFLDDEQIKAIFENAIGQPSDTDIAITVAILEYIHENYKEVTLEESINEVVTGAYVNQKLYDELYEALSDDFIAEAVSKVSRAIATLGKGQLANLGAKRLNVLQAKRAAARATGKRSAAEVAATKAADRADKWKTEYQDAESRGDYTSDIKGQVKKLYGGAKVLYGDYAKGRASDRVNDAKHAENLANRDRKYAEKDYNKLSASIDKSAGKIDKFVGDPIQGIAKATTDAIKARNPLRGGLLATIKRFAGAPKPATSP